MENQSTETTLQRAKMLSSAKVTFVEDSNRLERLGGVGGLLRYRISAEDAAPYEQSGVVTRTKALITKAGGQSWPQKGT